MIITIFVSVYKYIQTTIKHNTDTEINIQYSKLVLLLKEERQLKLEWNEVHYSCIIQSCT